jgi:hypothetical protein
MWKTYDYDTTKNRKVGERFQVGHSPGAPPCIYYTALNKRRMVSCTVENGL